MSGVLKIEITESQESLKELLSKQKTGKSKERPKYRTKNEEKGCKG
jgi:hypothetical protein